MKRLLIPAVVLILSLSLSQTVAAGLGDFEVELVDYDENNVRPGSSFDLQVRFLKPENVWVSNGKIYAYIYRYVENEKEIYNWGGEKSLASAEAYLYESTWGTYGPVEKTYQWTLRVVENAPAGEMYRIRITADFDLSEVKLKVGDNVYTDENLENWITQNYAEDPLYPGWYPITLEYAPTTVAANISDLSPPFTSPYLDVSKTAYDVVVLPPEEGIPYSLVAWVEGVIILFLAILLLKNRKKSTKSSPSYDWQHPVS